MGKLFPSILGLKKFLQELGLVQERYVLHYDSQSDIHLSKNFTFHSRSEHIDVRYHWIREVMESNSLQLEKRIRIIIRRI